MRCGCIYIGSNTTRLLVVDHTPGLLTTVLQVRAFTQLGRACAAGETIPDETLEALAEVVASQVAAARAHGVEPGALRVVATAAVRRAKNSTEACRALREAAGVEVEVLDAATEARLAFAGATGTLAKEAIDPAAPLGVVDVGGGSCELVVGTRADGVAWSTSMPFGSSDLSAAHLRSDPPTAEELATLRAQVAAAFAGLAGTVSAVLERPPLRVLAVGGGATSICRLVGRRLDLASLGRAVTLLASAPAETIAAEHDLDPVRVRLMPAAIIVLEAAAGLLGPIEVADGGLREGVVMELAGA